VGEFALGMAGAAWLARDAAGARRVLLGTRASLAGAALWLAGNGALYLGPVGWVGADLLIAAGLTLLVLNLAHRLARRRGRVYRSATWLGGWAYYLFLAHVAVGYGASQCVVLLGARSKLVLLPLVPAAVAATVGACRALRALDRSSLPARLARRLVPAAGNR
jgi:peptidoglycan/LPS O-acetylase OafA/YrhL